MSWIVRAAHAIAVAVVVVATTGGVAHAADSPTLDIVHPEDPAQQQVYEDGFTTGYFDDANEGSDDGYRSGYAEGLETGRRRGVEESKRQAEQQADLRDDVSETAEDELVDEGGRDLGDEIAPRPSATPTDDGSTSATTFEDDTDPGGGFPWWPLSFAVVATAWFVTRRRRLDAPEED